MYLVYSCYSGPHEDFGLPEIYGYAESLEEAKAYVEQAASTSFQYVWRDYLTNADGVVLGWSYELPFLKSGIDWFVEVLEPLNA